MNDQKVIQALKGLVIDGVDKAKSGHPGGAMSSMDLAYVLFTEFLEFDPQNPKWMGRDRFVLSAGHESMLIYSLLHANGWLEKSELQNFRQLGSKTPGHPENFLTPGVECTTGPLGQGASMSVGFAIAAAHLNAKFGNSLFGHHTWALLGDGCMQEDITYGSASLAGHLGLEQLIWIYDCNRIQISGQIDRTFSDDPTQVYQGLGWHVINIDGHNLEAIRSAYMSALSIKGKPTLIVAKTTMAKGAPSLEGSHKTHGAPLPADEKLSFKKACAMEEDFYWDESLSNHYQRNFAKKREKAAQWEKTKAKLLSDASKLKQWNGYFEPTDTNSLPKVDWQNKGIATRSAFGKVLEAWADELPNLMGGSADLEPSNMTGWFADKVKDFQKATPLGRNLAFGVREFPMSAITNGIALHGGFKAFDATFLTFSDYSRPALRLGALQKAPVVHEFTHDSFYLGEDGPTHQPIEHIMSMRLMPDMLVMRPGDAIETEVMMQVAFAQKELPTTMCLSRQNLNLLPNSHSSRDQIKKGAWFVKGGSKSQMIIFATGSEVNLALKVAEQVEKEKVQGCDSVAVVSLPCWELFEQQDEEFQKSIYCAHITKRVSLEAGVTLGWQQFIGNQGLSIGVNRYGASAPAQSLAEAFGFTTKKVCHAIAEHSF